MAELTKFECELTGELYGALNVGDGLYQYEVREKRAYDPYKIRSYKIHMGYDVLREEMKNYTDSKSPTFHVPSDIDTKYIGVNEEREIEGLMIEINEHVQWKERDGVVVDHYEPFFQLLEDKIIR